MATVNVKVLRILNGGEFKPGDSRELDENDAKRLAATGAVEIVADKPAKKKPKG